MKRQFIVSIKSICIALLFCLFVQDSFASDYSLCIENLKNQIIRSHSGETSKIRFETYFECKKADTCMVTYQIDNGHFGSSLATAYSDLQLNTSILNTPTQIDGSKTYSSGWTSVGNYFCADVNIYFKSSSTHQSVSIIQFSKETARDMLFCPVQKTFFKYQNECHALNQ